MTLPSLAVQRLSQLRKASVITRLSVMPAKALTLMSTNSSAAWKSKGAGNIKGNVLMKGLPHHKAAET